MNDDRSRSAAGAAGDVLLRAEGLAVGYGRQAVVSGIDFVVRRGEHWFLLGPNGAGKSTFARAVLGLLRPMAGRLDRSGELRRPGAIGYVPQHGALHPSLPMSLSEYVSLGFAGARVSRADCARAVEEALEAVALAGRGREDVRALSGGMRQRAMVARALVRRPALLVLDEPTSNLDPAAQEATLLVLARLRCEAGVTQLFISHDVAVAARYATHAAFFHDGAFEAGGREMLLREDVLRRVYGVDICVVHDDAGHTTLHVESAEALS